MNIYHLSAECYPAAKVGGLADVVGALPKYLQASGVDASVVVPKYRTDWIQAQSFLTVFEGTLAMDKRSVPFRVQQVEDPKWAFPLFLIDIPVYFDRPGIYGELQMGQAYSDEAERFIGFQKAALAWIHSMSDKPDLLHCHDHQTALIPFMITRCRAFKSLAKIPTVLTVHNAEYQGIYSHEKQTLLPRFDEMETGLLDWNGRLNSLATGLKCCWQISTVSPTYMKELRHESNGLEMLFEMEKEKSRGILNGIDTEVWKPQTDEFINHPYSGESVAQGKSANKKELCKEFGFDASRPLISFIGRLVPEKGADLLPDLFRSVIEENADVNFIVLGTGNPDLHEKFNTMSNKYVGFFDASLNYNEKLAHQIYAGSDFMIMPSRVEPCGLNQLYCMQYGTIPIVRNVGGLKDTVQDIRKKNGYGITFLDFTLQAAGQAIQRALDLYEKQKTFQSTRKKIMQLDFSWNVSAKTYIQMYHNVIARA